jgi:tetratricopeptide (TPR) repeat protein
MYIQLENIQEANFEGEIMRKKRLREHVIFPTTYRLRIIVILAMGLLFAFPVYAQEALWKELNSKVIKFYQEDQYTEAISAANEALKVAEETFGPEHPKVATSLNNLALIYKAQGKQAAAEDFYKHALTILEKSSGSDNPRVATAIYNLARLYHDQEKYVEAEPSECCIHSGKPGVALSENRKN